MTYNSTITTSPFATDPTKGLGLKMFGFSVYFCLAFLSLVCFVVCPFVCLLLPSICTCFSYKFPSKHILKNSNKTA